jgi:hypothetical protein
MAGAAQANPQLHAPAAVMYDIFYPTAGAAQKNMLMQQIVRERLQQQQVEQNRQDPLCQQDLYRRNMQDIHDANHRIEEFRQHARMQERNLQRLHNGVHGQQEAIDRFVVGAPRPAGRALDFGAVDLGPHVPQDIAHQPSDHARQKRKKV